MIYSELIRLELKTVPHQVALTFLRDWGEQRVVKGSTEIGIPHGPMPVSVELLGNKGDMGLKLIFLASPTDTLEVLPFSLRDGMSSALVLRRGEPQGAGISGHLGPQICSLIRSAESDIQMKLHIDAEEIAKRHVVSRKARSGINAWIPDHQSSTSSSSLCDPELLEEEHSPIFMGGEMRDVMSAYPGGKKELESKLKDSLKNTLSVKELEEHLDFRMMEEREAEGKNKSESKQQKRYGFHSVVEEFGIREGKDKLDHVLNAGKNNAKRQLDALKRQRPKAVALEDGLAQLEVALAPGLQGGLDIFAGPPKSPSVGEVKAEQQQGRDSCFSGSSGSPNSTFLEPPTYLMCDDENKPLLELTEQEFDMLNQEKFEDFLTSLSVLVDELTHSPKEMWFAILREYNSVLLHEYFVLGMRTRLPSLRNVFELEVLQAIQSRATVLVQELALVKQQDEMAQLEKMRDICVAALDDMSSLSSKVHGMKPLLDNSFVAYLVYTINRERSMLKDPVNSPSLWLQILQVIQRGTIAELSRDIRNEVDDISYVLRMNEPEERRDLLKMLIDTMPTLDVRKFREVGRNIVAGIKSAPQALSTDEGKAKKATAFNSGDGLSHSLVFSEAMIPNLRERIVEFGTMLEEYLTDERVAKLSKEADEWAARSMDEASSLRTRAEREVLDANNRRIDLEKIPGVPKSANTLLPRSDRNSNPFQLVENSSRNAELVFEDPGKTIDAEITRSSRQSNSEESAIDLEEESDDWGEFRDEDFKVVDFETSANGNCSHGMTREKDNRSGFEVSPSLPSEVADDWSEVYSPNTELNSNPN